MYALKIRQLFFIGIFLHSPPFSLFIIICGLFFFFWFYLIYAFKAFVVRSASWSSGLGQLLQSQDSVWVLVLVLTVPLPFQLRASVPGRAIEDGSSVCTLPVCDTWRKPLAPGFSLTQPWLL